VRITHIHIRAFGPFNDQLLEFSPGMTVIVGENESGKSSWHAAIFAALCGMRRGRGQTSEDRDFRRRYRPWDVDSWAVESRLELADGRKIEIAQDQLAG
jgi:DNA repair protein SbcC/Rad50